MHPQAGGRGGVAEPRRPGARRAAALHAVLHSAQPPMRAAALRWRRQGDPPRTVAALILSSLSVSAPPRAASRTMPLRTLAMPRYRMPRKAPLAAGTGAEGQNVKWKQGPAAGGRTRRQGTVRVCARARARVCVHVRTCVHSCVYVSLLTCVPQLERLFGGDPHDPASLGAHDAQDLPRQRALAHRAAQLAAPRRRRCAQAGGGAVSWSVGRVGWVGSGGSCQRGQEASPGAKKAQGNEAKRVQEDSTRVLVCRRQSVSQSVWLAGRHVGGQDGRLGLTPAVGTANLAAAAAVGVKLPDAQVPPRRAGPQRPAAAGAHSDRGDVAQARGLPAVHQPALAHRRSQHAG